MTILIWRRYEITAVNCINANIAVVFLIKKIIHTQKRRDLPVTVKTVVPHSNIRHSARIQPGVVSIICE